MSGLYKVFMEKTGSKERTAKVYAATVRRIHREVYKKELDDETLAFAKRAKTFNYVKKIVNLTRRKNAATAMLMALKAVGESEKAIQKYRKVMMAADADYQKFLLSGQRKRPYANAEKAWAIVSNLHKKVNKELHTRSTHHAVSYPPPYILLPTPYRPSLCRLLAQSLLFCFVLLLLYLLPVLLHQLKQSNE